jgi:uncharacterized protein
VSEMTRAAHVFYLHGFASSAQSTKAGYFAERLAPLGIALHCPDFNEPDFATLTMTRMIGQLSEALESLPDGPVALIGSSLGGTLAVLAAARFARVDRLVLLAPAVMFAKPGHHLLPPERLDAWRRDGAMAFFHYGHGQTRTLNATFLDDSLQYDPMETVFSQPAIIFQGRGDASVDFRTVERFAAGRPNVQLTLVDDDHSLMASLPAIWQGVRPFLGLGAEAC